MTASVGRLDALAADLARVLDRNAILAGAAVGDAYCGDATDERGATPAMVFRPRNTAEVAAILSACNAAGQPVVVQGGRTGLSGGARPQAGEVSLSLERMTSLSAVDTAAGTLLAEAGATLQSVQEKASDHDLMFGVDIGARGTATIGGNIATNAGGIRVLRYGMSRAQVLGLEAVLADGTILSNLKGLPKDNSGYDLGHCFIGTEGTLGVVTRACLKLHPKPRAQANAFCALPSLQAAILLLERLRSQLGPLLSAFEVIFPDVYAGVIAHLGATPPVPLDAGMYVLVEIQGQSEADDEARFAEALMAAYDDGLLSDVAVSTSARDYAAIWALREGASQFIFSMDHMIGFDIGLPIPVMQAFLDAASQDVLSADPDARFYIFGHLGDGNLHYLIRTREHARVADAAFAAVARYGGAVSAEHGIGLDKKRWLPWVRTPGEMAAMRRLKSAFDPHNILNPGRVFDMKPAAAEYV
ncbi:FAD-binding oxidoreductase [Rhizobium sp. SGZ-381]|uniref:FAD-binding oxidoreductase n=1 Tax=Rhizobium sp. SGZ-381 TaxID=3342800 RepID=UPI0036734E72